VTYLDGEWIISDAEKNEAVNRITWQLAQWRLKNDREAKIQQETAQQAREEDRHGT
jgi:hypothetical protein